jgi:hypothetical protein
MAVRPVGYVLDAVMSPIWHHSARWFGERDRTRRIHVPQALHGQLFTNHPRTIVTGSNNTLPILHAGSSTSPKVVSGATLCQRMQSLHTRRVQPGKHAPPTSGSGCAAPLLGSAVPVIATCWKSRKYDAFTTGSHGCTIRQLIFITSRLHPEATLDCCEVLLLTRHLELFVFNFTSRERRYNVRM